jgi:hypothetical protein
MSLAIVLLNVVLAAVVVGGILALHGWAIDGIVAWNETVNISTFGSTRRVGRPARGRAGPGHARRRAP